MAKSIVIVGASVAGVHLAEQLRYNGHAGQIVLIDRDWRRPYDKPPLSKGLLAGTQSEDDIGLLTSGRCAELKLDLLLGTPAVELASDGVLLADGGVVAADVVVIATGASARSLQVVPHVVTLRTADDALSLRQHLEDGGTLAVIGAGLIGGEVASVALDLGCRVVMIEQAALPLGRVLGPAAGQLWADHMAARGVELRLGLGVQHARDDGPFAELTLTNGESVTANTVLVAIGSRPNVEWLESSGIQLDNGVRTDGQGRVYGRCNTFAVGDVANVDGPDGVHGHRAEHWTAARTQAAKTAKAILELDPPSVELPEYVWSDQFGLKIQSTGRPAAASEELRVDGGEGTLGAVFEYRADGRLVGAVTFGAPRELVKYSRTIASGADVSG